MPTEPKKIYWDSCCYISLIEQTPGRIDVLKEIHEQAVRGEIIFVASALVIAEVVKLSGSAEPEIEQAKKIKAYFENPFISVRTVDRIIAEEASQICRDHPAIKPYDAVHIATALKLRCLSFHTYDGDPSLPTKSKRKRVLQHDGQIGKPALKIELPCLYSDGQPRLF
jgi:predicted nucleic acid-binding protein